MRTHTCVIGINGVQSGAPVLHVSKQHTWNYFTQTMSAIDYSILILAVFPLDQIAHVGVSPSVSLFGREIIFEVGYSNLCDNGT